MHALALNPFLPGKDSSADAVQYIANIKDGATAGFKFFKFVSAKQISITVRGKAQGYFTVYCDLQKKHIAAVIRININSKALKDFVGSLDIESGVFPLYFEYSGSGTVDFFSFSIV